MDYVPNGGSATFYEFKFKRVKSLFHGTCSPIQPNRSSITADLCQTPSFGISFTNAQWKTEFESPVLCFGSITTYEYLLPTGWSLNGTPSTGSWIAANNNVTVTADATTGNGQAVQIRAINTGCGAGLAKGSIVPIPISRPAPPLNITGSSTMCFPNNYTYTINGVPSGSTISWGTNSYYSLTASGNTATVTPTSAANGSTSISATVTLSCGPSFNVSKTVSIGAPYVTFNILSYPYSEPTCYEVWAIYTFQAQQATGYSNTFSGYQWGWRNLTNNTVSNDPTVYGSGYTFFPEDAGDYEIWVKATNACGVSTLESVKSVTVYNSCTGMRMQETSLTVFPNPTKGRVIIQIPENMRKNSILLLSNQSGLVVLSQKVTNSVEFIDLDLSRFKEGIYQLSLRAGNIVLKGKIIKQ